ncbi:hypothetical protein AVEN_228491-1 [Araneus ventricosus]|uniref:DUF5641 domain-containing protein n=1 Tax=Araneus ventricosus TaxID=182803 RepID=A0A4Y2SP93_ARAVE|nr:hypothetical protein AVEN_228491-1 [Araneus ventricosus]
MKFINRKNWFIAKLIVLNGLFHPVNKLHKPTQPSRKIDRPIVNKPTPTPLLSGETTEIRLRRIPSVSTQSRERFYTTKVVGNGKCRKWNFTTKLGISGRKKVSQLFVTRLVFDSGESRE